MKITDITSIVSSINSDAVVENFIEKMNNIAMTITAAYEPEYNDYLPFYIDVVLPEGTDTGDNRFFDSGTVGVQDLPIPLLWQVKTGSGHDGAYIVGRIDSIERLDPDIYGFDGWGRARGVFDTGPLGREAYRLVRGQFLRGVSADLDKIDATVEREEGDDELDSRRIKQDPTRFLSARIRGATLVAKAAFVECTIRIDDEMKTIPELEFVEDGLYSDDIPEEALIASIPVVPPRQWFSNPELSELSPITVLDTGQVYGHVASWKLNHIGIKRATKPPRSASNYKYFRTGSLRTDDGTDIPVGQLTLTGGHPDLALSAREAVAHYDDTRSAAVDVTVGEDRHGIWVAGALRSDLRPEQIRALRASSPSGDWRPINGRLELVAVACVNTPGFPVTRSLVAGGQIMALVAAGAQEIADLRTSEVDERLRTLETLEFSRQRQQAENRLRDAVADHDAALVASALAARERMESFSAREIEKLEARVQTLRERVVK